MYFQIHFLNGIPKFILLQKVICCFANDNTLVIMKAYKGLNFTFSKIVSKMCLFFYYLYKLGGVV